MGPVKSMPGGGRAAYFLALLLAAVLLVGLVRGMPGTSGSGTGRIHYETQRRAGRDYGVWYATDRLGNITCIEVVEMGR